MRDPLSERSIGFACLGFALWTLCSHLVVFAGGSLTQLMILYGVAGAAVLFVARRLPAAGDAPSSEPLAPPPDPAWGRRELGALVLALCAAGLALFWDDPIRLWALWVGILAAAAAVFVLREAAVFEAPGQTRGSELSLLALASACALYTLFVHRPDADDSFYVNMAVAAIDHPELPLLAHDTLHGRFDLPIHYPTYRLHSYELWNAGIARLSGIAPLAVFHLVSATLAAMLVPLSQAVLFRRLTPRTWLFSTLVFVVVLAVPGETPRWYGNFAFVRMWQGKSILLFVFLPLIYAYALDFARRGDRRSWLRLAAAQIAGLGCSSTALWAGPVGALVAMSSVLRPLPGDLRRFGLGALSDQGAGFAMFMARFDP